MTRAQTLAFIIGRVGVASLFILAGFAKIANYAATAERMDSVGLSPSAVLLPATIALELIGGLWLAIGARFAGWVAGVLAVFTLATNWWFHRFWELSGQVAQLELSLFFKNVSIAAALLMLAAMGGRWRSS